MRIKVLLCLLMILGGQLNAQIKFEDATKSSGISHFFEVFEGMFGGGAAVLDVNNDGFEDLYLTGGMQQDALYLNNGDGSFRNIFSSSGLQITNKYVTQGVASADVNKDGWVDLFITTITKKDTVKSIPRAENLFFLNNGNSTFTEATSEFRIQSLNSFSTGASFGDFNHDGYPDLFIGNYFQGYEGSLSVINDATIVNSSQTSEAYLLMNMQGRYFKIVNRDYGLNYKGFGFGGVFTDFDNDGDLDLQVNNDFGYKAKPNLLLRNNLDDERFEDISKSSKMDVKINAMGTAVGDYDNNGLLDYYITNIRFNRFMVNQGDHIFQDKSKDVGMDFVSISWGANFADFDHDTDLDLFVANGDLNPNVVPMPDFLFENNNGSFRDVAPDAGLNDYGIGRGSVVFDMENDGDLDVLVVNQKPTKNYPVESFTRLYKNVSNSGNWFKVILKGKQSDLRGIGSRVEVYTNGKKMIREVDGGSSHLSQNSSVIHFGIGKAVMVDSVLIKWMGGGTERFTNQNANSVLTVEETLREKEFNSKSYLIIVIAGLALIAGAIFVRKVRKPAT